MFGYNEEEIVGRSLSVLYRDEDRKNLRNRVEQLRLGNKVQSIERIMRRKNGRDFPVVVSLTPLADNDGRISRTLAVYNDISELKKSQQILEETQQRTGKTGHGENQGTAVRAATGSSRRKAGGSRPTFSIHCSRIQQPAAERHVGPQRGIKTSKFEKEDSDLIQSALGECSRMARLVRDLQEF